MGAGFLPCLQRGVGGGGVHCYATVGVAEEKVVVGHKLFELGRPSLCSCLVGRHGSFLMVRKRRQVY